jgi:hypothetical protein
MFRLWVRNTDSLIGVASVALSPLLACRPHFRCQNTNKTYADVGKLRAARELATKVRQVRRQREPAVKATDDDDVAITVTRSCDGYVPITQSRTSEGVGGKTRVGATRVVLSLEDLGPLEPAMPGYIVPPPVPPPASSARTARPEQQQPHTLENYSVQEEGSGNENATQPPFLTGKVLLLPQSHTFLASASCIPSLPHSFPLPQEQSLAEDENFAQVESEKAHRQLEQQANRLLHASAVPQDNHVLEEDDDQGAHSVLQFQQQPIPEPAAPPMLDPRAVEAMVEREVVRRFEIREAQAQQELEVWRRTEEAAWYVQLATKERQVLERVQVEALAAEESRAEQAREAAKNYNRLQNKLTKFITEVEAQKRKLQMEQDQLANTTVLKREELQLLEKRIKEKLEHEKLLMKYKLDSLEKQLNFAKKESSDAKSNLLQTEEEFARYRASQRETPESFLRAQVAKLQIENAELHSKLQREEMTSEAQKMESAQLQETVQKLARVLRDERDFRSRKELNQLRLDYVTREERYVLDCDRKQLGDIKKELDNLRFWGLASNNQRSISVQGTSPKTNQLQFQPSHHSSLPPPPLRGEEQKPRATGLSQTGDAELRRLILEKEELLESGSYDRDHYLIRELDRLIHLQQQC